MSGGQGGVAHVGRGALDAGYGDQGVGGVARETCGCGSLGGMAPDRDDAALAPDPSMSEGPAPQASTRAVDPDQGPPSLVSKQAREALATGRVWLARDVLAEHVETQRDPEALLLLGEVLHRMGDLPAAGAMWFGTSARGAIVDESIKAWRGAHDDDFVAMWESLPEPVRQDPRSAKVEALRVKAGVGEEFEDDQLSVDDQPDVAYEPGRDDQPEVEDRPQGDDRFPAEKSPARAATKLAPQGGKPRPPRGIPADVARLRSVDGAHVIAWILAALVAICTVVGLITILRWIVPG